ncbi:TPA: hypothetical protein ACH3X2_009443 [Trebouxia sp. C0005]
MRDVSPSSQQSNHEGYIKHEAVQLDAGQSKDSDSYRQASIEPKQARPCNSSDLTPAPNGAPASELVRLEAQRVQAKFVSNVDTGTEVILRFDFMTSYDTRVAMFIVHAAHFAGFIILLVQFINIMTHDGSTRRFKHNTAFICNIVVGGACLTIITVTFVIHAWRVWRACRQHKVWLPKRKRHTVLFLTETALQGVNLVCYIAPSVQTICVLFQSGQLVWLGTLDLLEHVDK